MRVTIKELRRIIKEEYAKVLEENEISGRPDERGTIDALTDISKLLTVVQRKQLASVFDHTINIISQRIERKPVSGEEPSDLRDWPPVNSKQWENQMEQLITDARALQDNNESLESALKELSDRFKKFQNLIDPDRNKDAALANLYKNLQDRGIKLDSDEARQLVAAFQGIPQ